MEMDYPSTKKKTIIRPAKGWVPLELSELLEYLDLIRYFVLRDLKSRYRQTALGPIWIILTPISSMVIFTFIFGNLANLPSDELPYPLFSYSGLIPWTYFSGVLRSAAGSLTGNMGLISKIYFPRLTLPIVSAVSALIDLSISLVILLFMGLILGYPITLQILWIPVCILLAMITAIAVGLLNASIIVRYRDWRNVVNYITQGWLYLSPIAYASSIVPENLELLYRLNPIFWVIEGFRWALFDIGTPPQPFMIIPVILSISLFVFSLYVFRRTEVNVVDWL